MLRFSLTPFPSSISPSLSPPPNSLLMKLIYTSQALGYNTPKSTGLNYGDKASRFEARALEYERKGNHAKAQRNRERAWRTREKHSVAHPAGSRHPNTYPNYNQQMSILRPIGFPGAQQAGYPTSGVYPAGTAYQTGTGYNTAQPLMNTRMSREQKAARFENKAILFERQGNALKAQKNREKVCISFPLSTLYLSVIHSPPFPSFSAGHDANVYVAGCSLPWTQDRHDPRPPWGQGRTI